MKDISITKIKKMFQLYHFVHEQVDEIPLIITHNIVLVLVLHISTKICSYMYYRIKFADFTVFKMLMLIICK